MNIKNMSIVKFVYFPKYNMETKIYSLKKLKVIKNWKRPAIGFNNNDNFEIIYILENCFRIPNDLIITKELKQQEEIKVIFEKYISLTGKSIFKGRTIFSPMTEIDAIKNGTINDLIAQSDKEIKFCLEND